MAFEVRAACVTHVGLQHPLRQNIHVVVQGPWARNAGACHLKRAMTRDVRHNAISYGPPLCEAPTQSC